ncbi:MAG: hypothetical protein KKB02_12385 [Alphaproteobacteria bacterium]|nr:hypothetical protein [Alphaproteobacteria bacterium]
MADPLIFLRDFNRYTGDGLPNAPVGAPLPIGDPSSGAYVPTKKDLRDFVSALAIAVADGSIVLTKADNLASVADKVAARANLGVTAAIAVEAARATAAEATKPNIADGFKFTATSPNGFVQLLGGNTETLGFDDQGRAIMVLSPRVLDQINRALALLGLGFGVGKFPPILDGSGAELMGFQNDGKARFAVSQDVANQVAALLNLGGGSGAGILPSTSVRKIGDSMTTPGQASAISTALGGRIVDVFQKGGQTGRDLAVCMGVLPLTITLTGNTLPASGGVAVTALSTPILNNGGFWRGPANLSVLGVDCVLSVDDVGNHTLTRNVSGSSVTVPPNTLAVLDPENGTANIPATNSHRDKTLIIELGRNGPRTTRADRRYYTIEPIRKIIDFLTPQMKRVVIINPQMARARKVADNAILHEGIDSALYATSVLLDNEMRREFGPLILDRRNAAIQNAIYDLGLTPTADDLSDIAEGCTPRQLFKAGDETHTDFPMQGWEGQFDGNHLRALGY